MTNYEKLLQPSMYDTLFRMNANLRTTIEHYPMAIQQPCIMTALGVKMRTARCIEHEADCGKCIADWLSEGATP